MKRLTMNICTAALILLTVTPALAETRFSGGLVVWRHKTDLSIEKATDFDGTSDGGEFQKEWEVAGSGFALVGAYELPRLASIYAKVGFGEVTVNADDKSGASPDVESIGLIDDGLYFALGVQAGGPLGSGDNLSWGAGLEFSMLSTDLDMQPDESWEYTQTDIIVQGTVAYALRGVDVYGGLRFVIADFELEEEDITQVAPDSTKSPREFERDGQVDLLLGLRGGGERVNTFFELAVIGTFGVTAGMEYRF